MIIVKTISILQISFLTKPEKGQLAFVLAVPTLKMSYISNKSNFFKYTVNLPCGTND